MPCIHTCPLSEDWLSCAILSGRAATSGSVDCLQSLSHLRPKLVHYQKCNTMQVYRYLPAIESLPHYLPGKHHKREVEETMAG